ncbi:fimbria/pilus periplasmic chaperone [Cupriavidus sp. 30B13]|uniref:fimbria/pilus periplasmic chaperone n=1 Tax=Cupriavidus sp. 30B13 TaxID=3384241 RepID=UPI003B912075
MGQRTRKLAAAAIAAAMLGSASAWAGVVISGTRVIYPAQAKQVTVKVTNDGKVPALLQSWIDDGNARADANAAGMPFTLLPPIARVDPGKGQSLRLVYTQEPLPQDRESVYWLNVLEVPPKLKDGAPDNVLQMAFRSRLKIFFRPSGLPGDANSAPARLTWAIQPAAGGAGGYVAKASNPTPYHVSIASAAVEAGGKTYAVDARMVPPLGSIELPVEGLAQPAGDAQVVFTTVNDYGAIDDHKAGAAAR